MDWDVQEVMTGASRADWLRYRQLWFSLLSQGELRAGTANSDTHSLGLEQVGYPRNLVFGVHDKGNLDVARFNSDIRAGHMVGTNGPVLEVTIDDGIPTHDPVGPDLDPRKAIPVTREKMLNIVVSGAPWIPIEEVRLIVNGKIERKITAGGVDQIVEVNHFAPEPWRVRLAPIPLSQVISEGGDYWLVVEAGMELPNVKDMKDLDGDGLPDLQEGLTRPDAIADLQAIAPGVWPVAFSNPFLIDRDGNGWTAPGLPPPELP